MPGKTEIQNPQLSDLLIKIRQLENADYITAHNLRGAASNIKMMSDILMDRNVNPSAERTKDELSEGEILRFINRSSNALLNSLNGLMDLVAGKLNKVKELVDCDIEATINNITTQLNWIIFQKKATITAQQEITHFNYVPVYLESLVYNLINNALKYSRPAVPIEITISTYMQNERVVLEVKDNGIGMNLKKYGDRLFTRNAIFHDGYESRGLGLYLVRSEIESLGGTIAAKSKVNEGTTFIVTF